MYPNFTKSSCTSIWIAVLFPITIEQFSKSMRKKPPTLYDNDMISQLTSTTVESALEDLCKGFVKYFSVGLFI